MTQWPFLLKTFHFLLKIWVYVWIATYQRGTASKALFFPPKEESLIHTKYPYVIFHLSKTNAHKVWKY